ncbi:hypothetical protein BH11BAC3_BH11BAC3_09580 [soil metagenome]
MLEKRISKRRYPAKECPQCLETFIPSDKRQKYCSEQHRVDYNNDCRSKKDLHINHTASVIKRNEQILTKIYSQVERLREKVFSIELLKYEGYQFNINTGINKNTATGSTIFWTHNYGLECCNTEKKLFIIHFRNNQINISNGTKNQGINF